MKEIRVYDNGDAIYPYKVELVETSVGKLLMMVQGQGWFVSPFSDTPYSVTVVQDGNYIIVDGDAIADSTNKSKNGPL